MGGFYYFAEVFVCAVHFKFVRDTVGLVLKKTKLSPIKAGTCWRNKKFTMVSFFYFGVSGRVLLPVYGGGRVEVLAGLECVWLCILFIIYDYYDVLCSKYYNKHSSDSNASNWYRYRGVY